MAGNDNTLEIEVKFFLESPEAVRRKLIAGATMVEPRVFETNLRYENPANGLIREGKLLRLRRDKGCRLTFKSRSHEQQKQFKIHRELEVEISDCDTMGAILQELGFKAVQVYEKWRETFSLHDALVCLDTMPYGDFLEIEGSESSIRLVAEQLGFAWENRILENYLSIFDLLRRRAGLPFTDVTFDNFRPYPVEMADYLDLLYAERG